MRLLKLITLINQFVLTGNLKRVYLNNIKKKMTKEKDQIKNHPGLHSWILAKQIQIKL